MQHFLLLLKLIFIRWQLTEAVHHSSFFVSFAYLNDCFLNDIDETVPSIAISTGMSFPICFKRSFAPTVCFLPATFNL